MGMMTSSSTAAGVVGEAVVAWSFRLEMELATGRKFTGLNINDYKQSATQINMKEFNKKRSK